MQEKRVRSTDNTLQVTEEFSIELLKWSRRGTEGVQKTPEAIGDPRRLLQVLRHLTSVSLVGVDRTNRKTTK